MLPASTRQNASHPLRIGIPWRTSEEQLQGERKKLDYGKAHEDEYELILLGEAQ